LLFAIEAGDLLDLVKLKSPADGGGFFYEYVIVFMEDSILKGWRNEKYQL